LLLVRQMLLIDCSLIYLPVKNLLILQHREPMRSLRSSSFYQLLVPHHKLTFGSRAFRFLLHEFGIHYLSVFVKLSHFTLLDAI